MPCLCAADALYKAPLATERSQDARAVQPSPLKMPLAAESYYAAAGSFCLCPAHALQAIPHHRKEAGKRVLCSHVS